MKTETINDLVDSSHGSIMERFLEDHGTKPIAEALDLIESFDSERAYDISHELADSDADVIYTYNASELVRMASSHEVGEAEGRLEDMGYELPDHCAYKPELVAYCIVMQRHEEEWESNRDDLIQVVEDALLECNEED